ncbi:MULTISPECIES: helix-turn-helix domain-containing protein [Franconibacter]|uniref:helix-turn-helix domain-containing protein n=1 Tax=Franconibacter TaxID=1649295 RepID=UPI00049649FA|nr:MULTISPECIES: helix-turn-helix domain-containing protein [Franconibacter]MEB5924005.1 helix-turn-helix transcriptional regulator [Franconibacter daqui]HBI09205.1 XRE family transcriptional regulator [Franconibacter pulveris]
MKTLDDVLNVLPPERQAEIYRIAEEIALENGLPSIREQQALSQQQMAEILGVTQPAIAAIERRGKEIKLVTLKRYVEAMGGKLTLLVELPDGNKIIPL